MDPASMMIMIGIGNMVGWLAALYVKGALPGLFGHVVVGTAGAFAAGDLCLRYFPGLDKPGMIAAAILGSVLLVYVLRIATWR